MAKSDVNLGVVKEVEGSVVVVYFEKKLPPIYSKLTCLIDKGTPKEKEIIIEVEDVAAIEAHSPFSITR